MQTFTHTLRKNFDSLEPIQFLNENIKVPFLVKKIKIKYSVYPQNSNNFEQDDGSFLNILNTHTNLKSDILSGNLENVAFVSFYVDPLKAGNNRLKMTPNSVDENEFVFAQPKIIENSYNFISMNRDIEGEIEKARGNNGFDVSIFLTFFSE